jgi:hypothetical protein
MMVGPSVWGPPSCEGLLCGCCVGVVNLTFFNFYMGTESKPKVRDKEERCMRIFWVDTPKFCGREVVGTH